MTQQRQPLQRFAVEQPFSGDQREHHQAPEHIVPARSVPDAGEQPYRQKRENHASGAAAASAERDVHIGPKPAAQRDMPAPPEFRYARGTVGVVEVLRQAHAQHFAQPDGHQGIAPEIEIKPQRVAGNTEPCQCDGNAVRTSDTDLTEDPGQMVGNDDLAGKAQDERLQSGVQTRAVPLRPGDGLTQFLRRGQRAGKQLGEHQHAGRNFGGRSITAPTRFCEEGDHLKGVKAQGQRQRKSLSSHKSRKLYDDERRRGQGCPESKQPFVLSRFALQSAAAEHGKGGHSEKQQDLQRRTPRADGIKDQASRTECQRAPSDRKLSVQNKENGEEDKQKPKTVKGHRPVFLCTEFSGMQTGMS